MKKTVKWGDGTIPGENIIFNLFSSSDNKHLATLKTDDNGIISYRLPAGDYYLVEDMSDGNYAPGPLAIWYGRGW